MPKIIFSNFKYFYRNISLIFGYKNLFFVFYHYFNIDKLKKSYICKLKINK